MELESNIPEEFERDLTLSAQDAAALDALIEAEFEVGRVDAMLRERAGYVARLLGLLEIAGIEKSAAGSESRETLIDATLARVAMVCHRELHTGSATNTTVAKTGQHRQVLMDRSAAGQGFESVSELSADDEDAIEELIGAGYDSEQVSGAMRARATKAVEILNLLRLPQDGVEGAISESGRDELVARTLVYVERRSADRRRMAREQMRLENHQSARRIRLGDLISVAAMLLIGTAVIGPMVSGMRSMGQRMSCSAGLGSVGQAFGVYANDSRDSLPMASASLAGTPWWNVGTVSESNSANLYTLARTGYTGVDRLACPTAGGVASKCAKRRGDQDWRCMEEVTLSFQNLFATQRPRWSEGRSKVVILVDRSPVIPLAKRGLRIQPLANSGNHGGCGQNALFSDGGVVFLRSPVLESGDNIWMPRPLEDLVARVTKAMRTGEAEPLLEGKESPADREDSFVGP